MRSDQAPAEPGTRHNRCGSAKSGSSLERQWRERQLLAASRLWAIRAEVLDLLKGSHLTGRMGSVQKAQNKL
jgi:hypothetical protein